MRSLLIETLHEEYRAGLSPVTVVEEVLDEIAAAGDPGIFISLAEPAVVRKAAKALGVFDPKTKPLWGVPFAVKDNIDVEGMPTTAACPQFAYTAKTNAAVVQRLIDAGALMIGKTNLDQFATGLVGVRTPYPIPRNAIDEALVPGGSSSGSAVAVSRGLVSFALGTDTAGSGRVPAALNNIVGLKPSLGLVSTRGIVPACRTLDCVSVFSLTVDDAWRVISSAAAYDEVEPYSRALPLGSLGLPSSLRIGVPDNASLEFFGDDHAAAAFGQSCKALRDLAGKTIDVGLGAFRAAADLLYAGPWIAERYLAIRDMIERNPAALHPVTRKIIEGARKFSAADAFAGQYRIAELKRTTAEVWDKIDVLVVPSIPTVCTLSDLEADPIGPNTRLGAYTNFVNLLDLCALAIPGSFRMDDRPAGVTLIAPSGRDALLAELGARLHRSANVKLGATALSLPLRALARANAAPDTIEIVLVGAHMSGMSLNREIKELGGTFVRASETEASYRLFALPGGPPHRPGLLRVASNEGYAIAVEVWALPAEAFGRFVSAIPAPLGIGTIRLADGTNPKGFLAEAEGIRGAADISVHGGWRNYIQSKP